MCSAQAQVSFGPLADIGRVFAKLMSLCTKADVTSADRGGGTHPTPGHEMTEKEKLIRGIRTLRETINRDWADLSHLSLSHDERTALRAHIERCAQDLKSLTERLGELMAKSK